MPSDDKKEPTENFNDKFRSPSNLKDHRRKKKAMPLKAHFSTWHHLYCYGKERLQLNSPKNGANQGKPKF